MPQLSILICGAGIAGNALAFWLLRLGHQVTVVERSPGLRTNGLQIDLKGHGITMIKRMGLEEIYLSKRAPEQGMGLVDRNGKEWAYFPASMPGEGSLGATTEHEIMREDFCRILYDKTKERAKYMFGTTIEGFENQPSSISVRFSDGTTGTFDLLVGADGVQSRVRKLMLGDEAPKSLNPLGITAAYFVVPKPIQQGEKYAAAVHLAPEKKSIMTRRHNANELQVYVFLSAKSGPVASLERGDTTKAKEVFAQAYHNVGWQTPELLHAMQDTDNFYWEHIAVVKTDAWSKGRATLVGDAGYAPTVMTGMGTTSAMVGAYILAGELGRHYGRGDEKKDTSRQSDNDTNIATALKSYQDKFQPFMDIVVKDLPLDKDPLKRVPATPFGVAMLYRVAWLCSLLKVNRILKLFAKDDFKDWELPDYEELRDSADEK